ncbi:hypothetical protein LTR84_006449 [Exophiala bonariae]|uniref:Oxysterol binding protein n=1 Tax=Exophiala bonariae TaxID=1690606 RepID=A0AAV9N4Q5_9EURO|nr:hypothetical protein LTR84_006449 [Exophiala bonariae]
MPTIDDPVERFVSVVKFYLSGWHIRPPGVKKPLNPILGETFTCYWDYPDNTKGYYISEQTSHHPPKSSYFFMAPEHHIRVDGTLKPRSRFLGNSAASLMEGISYLRFTNRGTSKGGEKYILTQPNMYARGILFGKMKYELGDHSFVRCPENNLAADLEFKTKGWVGGTYNAIGGTIKNEATGEVLYELSGLWSGEMFIKNVKTGQKKVLFDATHAKHSPPLTRPIEEQGERESQRLWLPTVKAVHVMDHEKATVEKAKIEDRQREEAKRREELGVEWQPKLFRRVEAGPGGSEEGEEDLEWVINAHLYGFPSLIQFFNDANAISHREPRSHDSKELVDRILAIAPILPGQKSNPEPESRHHSTDAKNEESAPAPAPATEANPTAAAPLNPAQATNNGTATTPVKPSVAPIPAHLSANAHQEDNLIDFNSRPPSVAPPEPLTKAEPIAGNPLHPTSHPQQTPVHQSTTLNAPTGNPPKVATNLMDDDDRQMSEMNNGVSNMSLHQPMVPQGRDPLKRTDTETSDVDVFVDAEG